MVKELREKMTITTLPLGRVGPRKSLFPRVKRLSRNHSMDTIAVGAHALLYRRRTYSGTMMGEENLETRETHMYVSIISQLCWPLIDRC